MAAGREPGKAKQRSAKIASQPLQFNRPKPKPRAATDIFMSSTMVLHRPVRHNFRQLGQAWTKPPWPANSGPSWSSGLRNTKSIERRVKDRG